MTAPTPAVPALRPVFQISAIVGDFLRVSEDSAEQLDFIPIIGGSVWGEVEGEVLSGGGDWCRVRVGEQSYRLEARYLFRTTSGSIVDVVNTGVLRHLAGSTGGPGEMGYFVTAPVFRTADPELAWLTRSVFVGQAVSEPGRTVISVYEVVV